MSCDYCDGICEICGSKLFKGEDQIFKPGDIAVIDNNDHIWHKEIVLIRETKHKFSRCEIRGRLTWLPNHWLKHHGY